MTYSTLSQQDLTNLRIERVRALEADHFQAVLILQENPEDTQAYRMRTDCERRIQLHLATLNGDKARDGNEDKDDVTPPTEQPSSG
jgi:hypothetical protein